MLGEFYSRVAAPVGKAEHHKTGNMLRSFHCTTFMGCQNLTHWTFTRLKLKVLTKFNLFEARENKNRSSEKQLVRWWDFFLGAAAAVKVCGLKKQKSLDFKSGSH